MSTLVAHEPSPLLEILEILDLTQSELAELFGIRQPSLAAWLTGGVPPTRRARVEELRDLARVLQREVIPSRIPEVIRRPDAWLGNRSMFDVIRAEGVQPVWAYLARLFRYAG
jgi:transcriptional regulator with XRE-family HTH domain